jgi:hypothetical protein
LLNLPTPPAWQPNYRYYVGDLILDRNGNLQTCVRAEYGVFPHHQSGSREPSWETAVGAQTVDRDITWACGGAIPRLPTFEVEFEGAGVWDLYQALLVATPAAVAAAAVCSIPAVGWIACAILILLTVAIAAVGITLGLTDSSAAMEAKSQVGEVHPGQDVLLFMGTFVYDSAHQGWNELHPVLFCQKLATVPQPDLLQGQPWQSLPAYGPANLARTLEECCDLATEAVDPQTKMNQSRPEYGWNLHPLVDGCV